MYCDSEKQTMSLASGWPFSANSGRFWADRRRLRDFAIFNPFWQILGRSAQNQGFDLFQPILADSGQIGTESEIWPFSTHSGRFWVDRRRIRDLSIFNSSGFIYMECTPECTLFDKHGMYIRVYTFYIHGMYTRVYTFLTNMECRPEFTLFGKYGMYTRVYTFTPMEYKFHSVV